MNPKFDDFLDFIDDCEDLPDGAFLALMWETYGEDWIDDMIAPVENVGKWKVQRINDVWFVIREDSDYLLKCSHRDQASIVASVLNRNNVTIVQKKPKKEVFGEGLLDN